MNPFLIAAASLAVITGLIHSFLGERFVFRRCRLSGVVPTDGGSLLHEDHVRILWATWHAASVLGWCVAAVLLQLAFHPRLEEYGGGVIARTIAVFMLLSAVLVFIGTRGRHLGWLGLSGVAALAWVSDLT